MKYYVRLRNEKGKEIGIGGNEYIDIDIMDGNKRIGAFTVRPNGDDQRESAAVFDGNDNRIDINGIRS